jgi:hypothetical protein
MRLSARTKTWMLAAAILLFFLGLAFIVLPAVLIDQPAVREAVKQRLSAAFGGPVDLEALRFAWRPAATLIARNVRFDRPDGLGLQSAELAVGLEFRPLLRGRFIPQRVAATSPRVRIPLKGAGAWAADPGSADPLRELLEAAEGLKSVPEIDLAVADGRVAMVAADGARFEFEKLYLAFQRRGQELRWSLDGASGFLQDFSTKGRLDVERLGGELSFKLNGFKPHLLLRQVLPEARFRLTESLADLDLALTLEGPGVVNARIQARAPILGLERSGRRVQLAIERLAAELDVSPQGLNLKVSELKTTSPEAAIEFTATRREDGPHRAEFVLKGRGDATGAREVALALLDEIREVRSVADILRGGQVPRIEIEARGGSWAELAELRNLRIRGRLEQGLIHIPFVGLDLDGVSGDADIAGGILAGNALQAHYRGTRGRDGSLRLGLTRTEPVLELDIFMRADLVPLPEILARVVPHEGFRQGLTSLQDFSGTAAGRLRLDGTLGQIKVEVDASELDLRGRYLPLPGLLSVRGGSLAYRGPAITLNEADAAIGSSTLSRLSLSLGTDNGAPLEAFSPGAVVHLPEVLELLRGRLPADAVRQVEGRAVLGEWRLEGRAFAPETWKLSTRGVLRDAALTSDYLPAVLRLDSGPFTWEAQRLRFAGWNPVVGRSSLKGLAGDLDWAGPLTGDLNADHAAVSIEEVSGVLSANPRWRAYLEPLAPLSGSVELKKPRLRLGRAAMGLEIAEFGALLGRSQIAAAGLARPLILDSGLFHWNADSIEVSELDAALGESGIRRLSATVRTGTAANLDLSSDSAAIALNELFRLLAPYPAGKTIQADIADLKGSIELSRLSLKGPLHDPGQWRWQATGTLQNVAVVTTFIDEAVEIPAASVRAVESPGSNRTDIRIDSARVRLGDSRLAGSGDIRLSPAEIGLDLEIAADHIDGDIIEKLFKRISRNRRPETRPLVGRLGVRAESLSYGLLRSAPFNAGARFTPAGTTIELEQTNFCGIPCIGRILVAEHRVKGYIVPLAAGRPLDQVSTCISAEKSVTSGTFNLDGAVEFDAPRENLLDAITGKLTFVAESGSVLRSNFFTRLLTLLSLTEIYRGQLPDFNSEGLAYNRMTADLELKDGKLLIHSWYVDGRTLWMGSRGQIDLASLQVDLVTMVSPFKTIDRIINQIPGIRWILGGRLVAIPLQVSGVLADPLVIPMHPAAVGTGILEMFGRLLMLPVTIIQPLVPGLAAPDQSQTESSIIRK